MIATTKRLEKFGTLRVGRHGALIDQAGMRHDPVVREDKNLLITKNYGVDGFKRLHTTILNGDSRAAYMSRLIPALSISIIMSSDNASFYYINSISAGANPPQDLRKALKELGYHLNTNWSVAPEHHEEFRKEAGLTQWDSGIEKWSKKFNVLTSYDTPSDAITVLDKLAGMERGLTPNARTIAANLVSLADSKFMLAAAGPTEAMLQAAKLNVAPIVPVRAATIPNPKRGLG